MKQKLKFDIVSDVVCPWCIIGYKRLQQAMAELADEFEFEVEWHAFELNPQMPAEGQDMVEHLTQKYGRSREEMAASRANMAQIGAGLGFEFYAGDDRRVVNTFDAHRLLFWAKTQGLQTELKLALFADYFTDNKDVSQHGVLLDAAERVGLERQQAETVLTSGQFTQEVRSEQQQFHAMQIHSVPSYIIAQKYLLNGAREPADIVNAIRQIQAQAA